MQAQALDLPGVFRLTSPVHADRRGRLVETFRLDALAAVGIDVAFVQHNHSRSVQHTIRGMHWQRDPAQGKLVTVTHGAAWDVVAEVRPTAPAFGRHVAVRLEPGISVWVPPGYAHGFCALAPDTDVIYALTAPWAAGEGRGVRWDDPTLAIPWPINDPVLSEADRALPSLTDLDPGDLPVVR